MGPKKDDMTTVLDRLQALESEVSSLKKENEGLKARMQSIEEEKRLVVEELQVVRGEQKKVASYSGVVRAEVEKVQARQERQDKVLREANLVVTGLDDVKEETEEVTREKVEEVLQKGLRLAPSGHGSVHHAVRLGKYAEGRKRPVLVKCKSSAGAGEVLKSRSSLKDAEGFGGVYVNPDRTPEERERVRKAVAEMKKLRAEKKEAYVTLQGDLVVVGEGGERQRTSFKGLVSESPWAEEAAAARAEESGGDSFVEVIRRGRSKKGGSTERAATPAPRA